MLHLGQPPECHPRLGGLLREPGERVDRGVQPDRSREAKKLSNFPCSWAVHFPVIEIAFPVIFYQ